MKARIFALILALAFSAFTPADARIGETVEQCLERYGPARPAYPPGQWVYTKDGITVLIEFSRNRVAAISYKKVNKAAFTDAEIRVLLNANASGQSFAPIPFTSDSSARILKSADGGVIARIALPETTIMICTAAFLQKLEKERAAEKERQAAGILKGF